MQEIKITTHNVRDLWELYEYYMDQFYKSHYSYIECMNFQEFVKEEVKKCDNCGEYITDDFGRLTEHDGYICDQCIEDGYGA